MKFYMTIIEGRRPKKKMHDGIGPAKLALGFGIGGGEYVNTPEGKQHYDLYVRGGKLLEFEDGKETLLYDVPRGTLSSELPWKK